MVQRTLAPRRARPTPTKSRPAEETRLPENRSPEFRPPEGRPARPHFLDRQPKPVKVPSRSGSSVKIHTDDWMQVELPRTDYVQAGLVALAIAGMVSAVTLLPAIIFFNWLALASVSVWAKSVAALPIACGLLGAWGCLRRAKSERLRARLLDELRN